MNGINYMSPFKAWTSTDIFGNFLCSFLRHWGCDNKCGNAHHCIIEIVLIESCLSGNLLPGNYLAHCTLTTHTWFKVVLQSTLDTS